jgi:hypothetical protein
MQVSASVRGPARRAFVNARNIETREIYSTIHVHWSPVLNWVQAMCFGAALRVTTLLEAHFMARIVIVGFGSRCIGVCALECAKVPI